MRTYPTRRMRAARCCRRCRPPRSCRRSGGSIDEVARGHPIGVVGVGFPGIIRDGVIEDSPNLQQMKGSALARSLSEVAGRPRARPRAERRRRGRGRHRRDARATRHADARLDARQRHRVWPLSARARRVGRRAHRRLARSEGVALRVRRPGPPRGHCRAPQHAPALPGHGAGGGVRAGGGRRRAMRRVRPALAPRASRPPPRRASTSTARGASSCQVRTPGSSTRALLATRCTTW